MWKCLTVYVLFMQHQLPTDDCNLSLSGRSLNVLKCHNALVTFRQRLCLLETSWRLTSFLLLMEKKKYKLQTCLLTAAMFCDTHQVDEHAAPEHKSARRIFVVPYPASCWHDTSCWMSSSLKNNSTRCLISLSRLLFIPTSGLGFYWLSVQEVWTVCGGWLRAGLSLSDPQSWTRYGRSGELHREYPMHQAPHLTARSPGWELISSLFHSLTLRALSLSSQQSWMCFSSASAHFNDLFSLVSCTWKAGSLLWSSYLSHAQPVVAGPKCPAWFSQAPAPKSRLWRSLTTDLQWSEITGTIWISCTTD